MQPADTSAWRYAAAVAAASLKEMPVAPHPKIRPTAQSFVGPDPQPASDPAEVNSQPAAASWVISRDPSPRNFSNTLSKPGSRVEQPPTPSLSRPFLHGEPDRSRKLEHGTDPAATAPSTKSADNILDLPLSTLKKAKNGEPNRPRELEHGAQPAAAASSGKRSAESVDKPLLFRKKAKKNKAEKPVKKASHQQTVEVLFRKPLQATSTTFCLSPSYELHEAPVEDAVKEFMFPIMMAKNELQPKWAACILCLAGARGNSFVYFQSFVLKKRKIMAHLESCHAGLDADAYVRLKLDEKLAFLRRSLPSFDVLKNNSVISRLEDHPVWNEAEYARILLSNSSAAQLLNGAAENQQQPMIQPSHNAKGKREKAFKDETTEDQYLARPPAKKRKMLPQARKQKPRAEQMQHLPQLFIAGYEDMDILKRHCFCSDDPDITSGRQQFVGDAGMEKKIPLGTENCHERMFDCGHAYDILCDIFQNAKPCPHKEILRLVLGDKLRDASGEKLATLDGHFLTPVVSSPPGNESSAVAKGGNQQHATPLFVLTLFYLMRGMPTSVIAELADALSAERESKEKANTESLLPLIIRGANSVCVENMRLTRQVLDARHKYSWALAFLTRPCPELGEDGVQVLVATQNGKMIRSDLHVVCLRHADNVDESVLQFFDAICPDWRSRFIGVNSGIDGADTKRKQVERKLFEVLKTAEGVEDVQLVDKEVARERRPIFVDVVAKMDEKEFLQLVDWAEKRFGKWLNKQELRECWQTLARDGCAEAGQRALPYCEANYTQYMENNVMQEFGEDWAPFGALRDLAYSLRPLYEQYDVGADQSGCFHAGVIYRTLGDESSSVDVGLERVMHARSLVRAWCMVGMTEQSANRKQEWSSNAGIWGENWVNWVRERCSEGGIVGVG